MTSPRGDNRGILDAQGLRDQVRFRRYGPGAPLRRFVEHYWLIDWDLDAPRSQYVVPHPTINLVWMPPDMSDVVGVDRGLFNIELSHTGRVFGVMFRPGGFRPFLGAAMSTLTDKSVPITQVFESVADVSARILRGGADNDLVALADEFLTAHVEPAGEANLLAIDLAQLIREDRSILRVEDLARHAHRSPRGLQRLFAEHIGISPKWVIRRYRIHEAIESASTAVDWGRLAGELGYADQAHLVRDFTAAARISPAEYARAIAG